MTPKREKTSRTMTTTSLELQERVGISFTILLSLLSHSLLLHCNFWWIWECFPGKLTPLKRLPCKSLYIHTHTYMRVYVFIYIVSYLSTFCCTISAQLSCETSIGGVGGLFLLIFFACTLRLAKVPFQGFKFVRALRQTTLYWDPWNSWSWRGLWAAFLWMSSGMGESRKSLLKEAPCETQKLFCM